MRPEVLIIGGGIIGLSIARELLKRGVGDVAIVERGDFGREASWAAAGMLAPNIETDSDPVFHRFGREALAIYPEFAESLYADTGIDIELDRSGTFCVAFDESEADALRTTYEHQIARGVEVELHDGSLLRSSEPNIADAVVSALFYPNDWQVENRRMLVALESFARSSGVQLIGNTEVRELVVDGDAAPGVVSNGGLISAGKVIIATGAWTSLIQIAGAPLPVSVKPIRGQMISFHPSSPLLRHVVYSRHGYLVPRADGRLLVGATVEDVGFEKATTDDGIDELRAAAIEIIPSIAGLPVADSWSGLRPFASSALPIIGEIPGYRNVFVATAHYRNGILLAPLTARILADKIIGGADSEYLTAFGAVRSERAANGELA